MPKQLNYDMLKESPESALRSVGIKSITAPPVGWTTEYQRQFTWKYSYPPKTKDQEASTGNGLIHANSHSCAMQTDILPPRPPASPKLTHVPLYRDEAIQAAPPKILQNKATQKALTVTSGIQTDLPTARENIAHKPSPVYSDEGIDVDGAAVSPQRISKVIHNTNLGSNLILFKILDGCSFIRVWSISGTRGRPNTVWGTSSNFILRLGQSKSLQSDIWSSYIQCQDSWYDGK